jgi:hypothetical protein
MLYILALVLGVAAGLLLKGKLADIVNIKFEKMWLILLAFTVQAVYRIIGLKGFDTAGNYTMVVYGLSYAALLLAFWYNRRFMGISIMGTGCFLNASVILANEGKMPVSAHILKERHLIEALNALQSGLDNKHILAEAGARLTFLSDVIPLPGVINYGMYVVSVGDLLIVTGLFVFAIEAVTGRRILYDRLKKETGYNISV